MVYCAFTGKTKETFTGRPLTPKSKPPVKLRKSCKSRGRMWNMREETCTGCLLYLVEGVVKTERVSLFFQTLKRKSSHEDIASSSLVQPAQRLEGAGGDGEPVLVDSFRMADRPDAATPASGGAPARGASWHGIIKKSSSTGSRAFNKARTGNDRSLVGRKIKLLKTSTLHSRGAGGVVRITSSTPKILNFGVGNSEYVRKEEIGTSWQVLQDSAVTTAPAAAAAGGGGGGSPAVPGHLLHV